MARILINGEWYNELSANALRESEFENIFLQNVEALYPDYYTLPFKITVESEFGTAKADLALIDKDYVNWWVVEVEMSRHSLNSHVLPQVRCLASAVYEDEVANFFHQKRPELNLEKLKILMKGKQPRVMVVLDIQKEKWAQKLEKYNAIVSVFQVFASRSSNTVFRINGEYPHKFSSDESKCYFTPLLNKFLKVESPAILTSSDKEKFPIIYNGSSSIWKRIDIKDTVYLYPVSNNPLNLKSVYLLKRDVGGIYLINELTNSKIYGI